MSQHSTPYESILIGRHCGKSPNHRQHELYPLLAVYIDLACLST